MKLACFLSLFAIFANLQSKLGCIPSLSSLQNLALHHSTNICGSSGPFVAADFLLTLGQSEHPTGQFYHTSALGHKLDLHRRHFITFKSALYKLPAINLLKNSAYFRNGPRRTLRTWRPPTTSCVIAFVGPAGLGLNIVQFIDIREAVTIKLTESVNPRSPSERLRNKPFLSAVR